ncbi:MAG: hypothetical protein HQL15_07660 [Candidatus Omnitrophica bacterium]|nr:hypothetical protein [Candidatus Omnitrophota bacterium]
MKRHAFNNIGTSLLEILLAAVIFVTAITGFYATMANIRKMPDDANKMLISTSIGANILEDMRSQVDDSDYSTCSTGNLAFGSHQNTTLFNGVTYTYKWTVSCGNTEQANTFADCTAARKVDISVSWP